MVVSNFDDRKKKGEERQQQQQLHPAIHLFPSHSFLVFRTHSAGNGILVDDDDDDVVSVSVVVSL